MKTFIRQGLFALAYFVVVAGTCVLAARSGVARSIWPASGLALAALIVSPRRQWPTLAAVIVAATAGARLLDGNSPMAAVLLALPNAVEALIGAAVMTRLFGSELAFRRVKEVIALAAVAGLGCGAVGTFAVAVRAAIGSPIHLWSYWRVWSSADALGVLLVTPFVVSWYRADPPPAWRLRRYCETAAFALSWGLALWFVFGDGHGGLISGPRPYLAFLFLVWAGLRLGMRGATLAVGVLGVVAIAATRVDNADVTLSAEALLLVQVFIGTATFTTILLAASLSERRTAEAALTDRDYRNRMLLAGLPVAVYTTDANGCLTSYNQASADLWGRLPSLLTERWCGSTRLLTPAGEVLGEERYPTAQALASQTAVRGVEALIERPDGSRLPVMAYATPLRNTSGATEGAMNVMVEISERKRAEALTLAANERYARQAVALDGLTRLAVTDHEAMTRVLRTVAEVLTTALDVDRVGIWRLRQQGATLFCEELFERHSGQHSTGVELAKAAYPVYFAALEQSDQIAANHADVDPRTAEFTDAYLRPHNIASMLDTPIHSGGKPIGVLCCEHVGSAREWTKDEQAFAVAVTNLVSSLYSQAERLQLEHQLWQSQKLEAVGQLAGGIAHDFNNLLTVIMGEGINLQLDERLPADARAAATEIVQSSERGGKLTRQLLAFSRRQAMRPKPLDVNLVVADLARMLQRLLGKHVSMDCLYAPGELMVNADSGMLDQVIMNLAVNARDAMPKGGQLTIETSVVEIRDPESLHPDARNGSFVCLRVTDSGKGIAADDLPRIFEPFFTTKGPGEGTGLGLATTYGIVRQHQGWLTVESQLGAGTTFRVFLPLVGSTAAAKTVPVDASGGGEMILLVEDDAALRTLVRNRLIDTGYNVIEAGTAEEARQLFDTHVARIDLLLTDITLPGDMSGVALARELSARQPSLKILYTSAYQGEVAGTRGLLRGQPNFLAKPFTMTELSLAVRRALFRQLNPQ